MTRQSGPTSAPGLVGGFEQGPSFASWNCWYTQRSLELTAIVPGLREAFSLLGSGGQWGKEIEEEARVKGGRAGRGGGSRGAGGEPGMLWMRACVT